MGLQLGGEGVGGGGATDSVILYQPKEKNSTVSKINIQYTVCSIYIRQKSVLFKISYFDIFKEKFLGRLKGKCHDVFSSATN